MEWKKIFWCDFHCGDHLITRTLKLTKPNIRTKLTTVKPGKAKTFRYLIHRITQTQNCCVSSKLSSVKIQDLAEMDMTMTE